MKINQERFPSLFDDKIVTNLYTLMLDEEVRKHFEDVVTVAKTNLTYMSTTIMTPMLESYEKLIPHRKELKDSCRGLIFTSKRGNPHVFMYAMFVDEEQNRINIMCQISVVNDNGGHYGTLFSCYIDRDENDLVNFRSYKAVPPIMRIEMHDEIVSETLRAILAAELFINFAEVETKVMKPNTQIWDERGVNAIYNNKTKQDITVIDSTWYTHLISSGAFKVRGHFRFQPYGPGLSKRKLTWINEFEKEGYTRKAKIEN